MSHEPRIQQLSDELAAGGYRPFHAPCGVLLDEAEPARSTCIRCTWCDGYPCLVHAKADAETIAVRPLLDMPNVTLLVRRRGDQAGDRRRPGARSPASSSTATGPASATRADIVVVSAGASNSAKLLLRSANDRHPNGLANGSDQVGRNYMFHNCKAIVALAKERNDTRVPEDDRDQRLLLRRARLRLPGRQHPDGRQVERRGDEGRGADADQARPALVSLADVAHHAVDFWLTTEDLPKPENRVTLDGDGNIQLAYKATNDDEADRLYHELKKLLNHIGMADHHVLRKNFYMHMDISVAGVAHQAGTCRFGTDPATSVLDANCKAHELDNLYVVDTSFFPSIGAVNPALTAMANAIRVGEHLAERLG